MKKKLVVCDIDSTLIVKYQPLSDRSKAVINELKRRGIYFGIASGRTLEEIRSMMNSWGYDDFELLIGLNGAAIWDDIAKKKYEDFVLKKEWIREILDIMAPYPKNNIMMYRDRIVLCDNIDDNLEHSSKVTNMIPRPVKSWEEYCEYDNAKIMFRVTEEEMARLEVALQKLPNDRYQWFKTQSTLLEFAHRDVSKGYALKKFCELENIPMEAVMAFGDTTNDNDLLAASGWGVCMQNGSDDTKQIADDITEKPCTEDGWADYMEKFLRENDD